jgi:hypothetical protein
LPYTKIENTKFLQEFYFKSSKSLFTPVKPVVGSSPEDQVLYFSGKIKLNKLKLIPKVK